MTSVAELLETALQECDSVSTETAKQWLNDDNVFFVDVRDANELIETGKVPNAVNLSRGMLEFLIDPHSPYHNQLFVPDTNDDQPIKKYVVYCAKGGRSALSAYTMKQMGYSNVYTMEGGFQKWCETEDTTTEKVN